MKFLKLIVILLAFPALADWEPNLLTEPPAGQTWYRHLSTRESVEDFFFIPAESTTDSTWKLVPVGYVADICLDSDIASVTPGAGTLEVQVYYIPENEPHCCRIVIGGTPQPPEDNVDHEAQLIWLSVTLDGVGTDGGTTNDCIRNFPSGWFFKIHIVTASQAGVEGLVSAVTRRNS